MILYTVKFPMIVFIFVSLGMDNRLNVMNGIVELAIIGILNVVWIIRIGSFGVVSMAWIVKLTKGLSNSNKSDGYGPSWMRLPFDKS